MGILNGNRGCITRKRAYGVVNCFTLTRLRVRHNPDAYKRLPDQKLCLKALRPSPQIQTWTVALKMTFLLVPSTTLGMYDTNLFQCTTSSRIPLCNFPSSITSRYRNPRCVTMFCYLRVSVLLLPVANHSSLEVAKGSM